MNPPPKDIERAVVVTDPDPTERVKEALELAIKNLDEKFDRRLQGIDTATVLAREELKEKLIALQSTLTNAAKERADANKDLVEKLEKSNQSALAAALLTQKEGAGKTEVALGDLIKQAVASFETAIKVVNEKIDRLTSRMDTGVDWRGGVDASRMDYREQARDSTRAAVDYRMYIIAVIGVIMAVAAWLGFGTHK